MARVAATRAHVRHQQVHQHHVGEQFAREPHGVGAARRLADHAQVGLGAQKRGDALAHERVIVHNAAQSVGAHGG